MALLRRGLAAVGRKPRDSLVRARGCPRDAGLCAVTACAALTWDQAPASQATLAGRSAQPACRSTTSPPSSPLPCSGHNSLMRSRSKS